MYYCPGCISDRSAASTPIMHIDRYIEYFFDESVRAQVEGRLTATLISIKSQTPTTRTIRCYFADNPGEIRCGGNQRIERVIKCNHSICYGCLLKYLEAQPENEPIKCMANGCKRFISHAFIRTALEGENNRELRERYWRSLKTPGEVNLKCVACDECFSAPHNARSYRCSCGTEICTKCGLASHADIPCLIAMNSLSEYREERFTEGEYFEHARSLYQWSLHKEKKKMLEKDGKVLDFRTVTYVHNSALLEKYNKAKQEMIDQGIDPGEMFVYHGSLMKNYPEICRKGVLIGGKDVKVAIGSAYGFGVYTATDPTMSIHFSSTNGKLLICRLLVGLVSPEPIRNVKELDTTKFHSYFADFKGVQSNYYISFKSDYVLPTYIVEYG